MVFNLFLSFLKNLKTISFCVGFEKNYMRYYCANNYVTRNIIYLAIICMEHIFLNILLYLIFHEEANDAT